MTKHFPVDDQFITKAAGDEDEVGAAEVVKAIGDFQSAVEKKVGDLGDEVKAARKDASDAIARLDAVETALNRPGGAGGSGKDKDEAELKAFGTYLRRGAAAGDEVLKALGVSSDPQGGYLAPTEFSAEFIRNLVEFSPIRTIATVRTTMAPAVAYPKRTSVTNAAWKGELQAAGPSEPAFGQVEIPIRELNTYTDVSNALLADSGGQAEAEIRLALAEDFGKKEGTAFVSGDGILAPEGILTNSDVAYTANGNTTAIDPDALVTLMYALPATYRNRGTWLLNGATLAAIRKLKDGEGRYLWAPAYAAGQPETIMGRPVLEAVDMPNVASNAFPIAFGDFATAFRIVDRVDMSVLVNPYVLATNGVTRMHATRRVGARVVMAAALRKLKYSAS